jgi:hypothetical protein
MAINGVDEVIYSYKTLFATNTLNIDGFKLISLEIFQTDIIS